MNRLLLRNWPPRRRRWALRLAFGFAVYSLVGFFLVPAIVKAQLIKRLPALTQRQAAVRQVRANPWMLSLTVRGLALTETNGQPFASFEEFYANFQLSSLFRWAWTFDEIRLQDPRAELILDREGRFNGANLFAPTARPATPQPPGPARVPSLLVFHLVVTNGYVGFGDLTRKTPFHTAYTPINVDLEGFNTKPNRPSPYSFEASSDSGRGLSWAGTVTAQPPASSGTLRITEVQLPRHAPYLEDFTRAKLSEGTMDLAGGYRFALGTNGMDLVVSNLAVTVSQLLLKDPDTGEAVLRVPSYELSGGSLDWRARQVRVGSLVLTEPSMLVRRLADGSINLPSLVLRRLTTASPTTNTVASAPWVFTLDEYRLERGAVQLEDVTVPGPFRTLLKPVSMRVEHFTTRPDSHAALMAEFTTEAGETVNLAADYSINPVRAQGTLKLGGIALPKYQAYLQPFFRGEIAAGKSDLSVDFNHLQRTNLDEVRITNGVVRVTDLQIKSPQGGEILFNLSSFAAEGVSASLLERTARVGAVRSAGLSMLARRETDGAINLLNLLVSTNRSGARPTNTSAPGPAPPWRLVLDEVALRDFAVRLEDRQTSKLGVLALDQLALTLRGAQFPSNAPVQIDLSARVNTGGTVSARGTVWPYSPAAEAEVEVAGVDLRSFQPWVPTTIKLAINSGAVSTRGRVRLSAPTDPGPRLHFAGGLAVTNFATTDAVLLQEFVRWEELAVEGIEFDLLPTRVAMDRVRFGGLKTSVIIGPDKRPNFLAVLPGSPGTNAPGAGTPSPAAGGAAPELFPLRLGELKLENAAIHFGDQSVQPPCRFDVQQLDGTIKGLSSEVNAIADVDLSGRVDEQSPFGLSGKVSPLARELLLNLSFTNRNLQLAGFTPYMEKFAGYPLHKGRLTVSLHCEIEQKKLKAENQFQIDQLTLGPRNKSPDATKLPVKLAVALLKDRQGRIALDLPLSGRTDDPEFRVGPVLLKIVVNLIAKIAASPFKLLGALVGGGEELGFVAFAPGEARLLEGETNKIDKLTKALLERPAVNLEIEASADPRLDRDALARQTVQSSMKALRLRELNVAGQTPAADGLQVEPAEYERLLRAAVVQQFGTNLTEALRTLTVSPAGTNEVAATGASTPGPSSQAAARPIRKLTFAQRLTGWLPLQKKNSPAALARQQAKADLTLLKQNPELGTLTPEVLESLLGSKLEVPPESFLKLMQDRAHVVQKELLRQGQFGAERLLLIAPKPVTTGFQGEARVNLSLN